jgi:hypothetical protein
MKRVLVIASLFVIAGIAGAGVVINHGNPVPNLNNPMPPCTPTDCK